ncbi:efflux RND transporter periplasmic adaptor subunit [Halosquirtibacter laminarini]|uniref:Efflux RND transporter periplasmic adaptor subunit n=1 Tax=Halosquirtibacter laminarini TaxID=3374600 RepID=A0AC61NIT7_9BACT|nr:efflux RND transporter periplasmic adaptor subunit [Prolixibacteraceae bacterium]
MKKIYIVILIVLGLGIFIGSRFQHSDKNKEEIHTHTEKVAEVWSCSMHPSIRQDHPGKCPICGMDLIKIENDKMELPQEGIHLSEEAKKQAELETFMVEKMRPFNSLSLTGQIEINPKEERTQSVHLTGRIESINVSYEGEYIKKGAIIATLYSPELITAQKELIESKQNPRLKQASIKKLEQWKINKQQIEKIEHSGVVIQNFPIIAEHSGYISNLNIHTGDYLKAGQKLYNLNSYQSVWAILDLYAQDQKQVAIGDTILIHATANPSLVQTATISFIAPTSNSTDHTTIARAVIQNRDREWKPNTFIQAKWNTYAKKSMVVVPKSAVMWTGQHSIVYVENEQGNYIARNVVLGPQYNQMYEVVSGLHVGEKVVKKGTFIIDASAELAHKSSMMNPPKGHSTHHAMKMVNSEATISVNGKCELCKKTIETAAKSLTGVTNATWNKDSKKLSLHYMPKMVSLDQIELTIANKGYDTQNHKAKDSIYKALPKCCQYNRHSLDAKHTKIKEVKKSSNDDASLHATKMKTKSTIIIVNGNCGMCKKTIESTANAVSGVTSAKWDKSSKKLSLQYMPSMVSLDNIEKNIANKGYDTPNYKAKDSIYNQLPSCCQYRK